MDGSSSEITLSQDIVQVLTEIGEWERLKGALARDFDGTFNLLEKIPEEVIRIVISHRDGNERTLWECIFYVQEVVERILRQRIPAHLPRLDELEKDLHTSLEKALISLESLCLIEKYLQDFCNKYPPQRIPDWGNLTNDDSYYGLDYNDRETWIHDVGGQDSVLSEDVGKNEKMTLLRSIRAIQYYISHLNRLIPPDRYLHPEETQKHIAEESTRIKIMKEIMHRLRDMLEWGKNHMPYRTLCAHGEPLGPNLFSESYADLFDTISTWERICKRLNLNEKKD